MLNRLVLLLVLLPTFVGAQDIQSITTSFDLDMDCVWNEDMPDGESATCKGLDDTLVYVLMGDNRIYIGYGDAPAQISFPGSINAFTGIHPILEWRLINGRPFASISHWTIESMNADGIWSIENDLFVVSTVSDGALRQSCQVGYVDMPANPDPSALARELADKSARGFRCGIDIPAYVGLGGGPVTVSVELSR
ncbi:MAG: hypothetical protein JKY31_05225 [Rhodobacteraceae bacterium]|nr:hypothetical protein [Paracoccaceae bacterium]